MSAGGHPPPPDLAAAATATVALEAPPVADSFNFPPGIIPQLVKEKLTTDEPYSPLSTLDISKAELPQHSEPDAYLQSRLDRFYAELQV